MSNSDSENIVVNSETAKFKQAAIGYASHGYAVFPIYSKTKVPCTDHGYLSASKDIEQVKAWWDKWPTASIGVLLKDDEVVLDVDKEGKEYFDSWKMVADQKIPPCPKVITPDSGQHYWLKTKHKNKLPKAKYQLNNGVELKTKFITVPPSIHENGKAYMWDGKKPWEWDYNHPKLPNWIVTVLEESPTYNKKPFVAKGHKLNQGFDLEGWLEDHELSVISAQSYQGAQEGGTKYILNPCPFDEEHTNQSAVIISFASGGISFMCHHTGCSDKDWHALRSLYEPNWKKGSAWYKKPTIEEAEAEAKANGKSTVENWQNFLQRTEKGKPLANLNNVLLALRHDQDWQGVLTFNEFSLYTTTKKPAPHQTKAGANWTDNDDSLTTEWMQQHGLQVSTQLVAEAVNVVAKEHSFHPVKDYFNGLVWDKTPRLDTWLIKYLGAKDTEFIRAIGPRWMISAVARIMRPGCQADHTLMLEGPQGIFKSTALSTLSSDEWFADHISALGSKDSRLELHGKIILELAEMDRPRHGKLEAVKAFLTARIDQFRPPYGRRIEAIPRSCVFAATINDSSPLTDETGNRRFWPVHCGSISIEGLKQDRDQLWAEAYEHYKAGGVWWLETKSLNELATEEQEQRYAKGVWDDVILEWVEDPKQRPVFNSDEKLPAFYSDKDKVTVRDILLHGVGKTVPQLTPADNFAIVKCLTHAGWTKMPRSKKKETRDITFYVRKGAEVDV